MNPDLRLIPWTHTETTFDYALELMSRRPADFIASYLRSADVLHPITPASVAAIRPLGERAA